MTMKNISIGTALLAFSAFASAGSLLGLSGMSTKYSADCAANNVCKTSSSGFLIRGVSSLPKAWVLNLEPVSLDAVEIGVAKYGTAKASGLATETYYDPTGTTNATRFKTRQIATENKLGATSLYAAAVAHMSVVDDFRVGAKLGVAYVTTTSRFWTKGASLGAVTESNFSPLLGISAEYAITENFRVVADFDALRFKTSGESGSLRHFSLGALVGF